MQVDACGGSAQTKVEAGSCRACRLPRPLREASLHPCGICGTCAQQCCSLRHLHSTSRLRGNQAEIIVIRLDFIVASEHD